MNKVDVSSLQNNIFDEFNKGWALLSAGNKNSFNAMTISWGQCGHLWHRNIITVYVRPTRYTKEFLDNNELFTVSFFSGNKRKELAYLGKVSGREENKVEKSKLDIIDFDGCIGFNDAEYIFVCKKIYVDQIKPDLFIDKTIDNEYPLKDYHYVFIGEINEVYKK